MYPNQNSNNAPYPPYNQSQAPPYPPQVGFPQPGAPQTCPYPTQGGYPPQGQGGYPSAVPPYPPQQGQPGPGYPSQPGYPPVSQGSYPAPGYPPSPFGQASPYPAAPSYGQGQPPVSAQQPYPQQQATAYPTQGSAYPTPTSAYPTQGSAYLTQASAYPPVHGGNQQFAGQHQPGYAPQGAPAMSQHQYQDVPSIRPVQADPMADAQALRKAMKGIGTDEKTIINILTKRSDAQRQAICVAFKASFGKDLIKDLKSELGGKLEDVIISLMTPRIDYLAQMLRKAVSGIGTKESLLVDILCTASNAEIRAVSAAYQRLYGVPMERDLKGDTSGHFMRLLVSISTGSRSEDPYVNQALASEDAQKLLSAGEKKWGTDESTFNMVLATRSYAHLRMVFHEYERLTGHGFERAIQREFSGDVETGFMAIVKSAKNRADYFASRLHDSLAGMGTKDNDLIFIMVSRADIDLGTISQQYQKLYGKSLANDISGDTSGDYKKVLLGLLGM